jgi:hypothetical protein
LTRKIVNDSIFNKFFHGSHPRKKKVEKCEKYLFNWINKKQHNYHTSSSLRISEIIKNSTKKLITKKQNRERGHYHSSQNE